jgi:TPR repeat protein
MMDKRLVLRTIGAAVAVGIMIGASPSIFADAADFKRGLMGEAPAGAQLSAKAAAPALQRPLSTEEQQELEQGLLYMVKGQAGAAAHLLGKYAMLGEPNAQMQIGAMYYFGKGLPLNRDEGMQWLRLSAAQGSSYGKEALSAAMSGSWTWETPAQRNGDSSDEFRAIVARYARENGGISIREYAALA